VNRLPKKYCSSAWIEGLMRADGSVSLCCRANKILGDWRKQDLSEIFDAGLVVARQNVIDGIPVTPECIGCVKNGQTTQIKRIFEQPIDVLVGVLEDIIGSDAKSFYKLHEVLNLKSHDSNSKSLLENLTSKLSEIKKYHACRIKGLNKLKVIIESIDDYLSNSLNIRHYAPWRQSQIVIHCNARCI